MEKELCFSQVTAVNFAIATYILKLSKKPIDFFEQNSSSVLLKKLTSIRNNLHSSDGNESQQQNNPHIETNLLSKVHQKYIKHFLLKCANDSQDVADKQFFNQWINEAKDKFSKSSNEYTRNVSSQSGEFLVPNTLENLINTTIIFILEAPYATNFQNLCEVILQLSIEQREGDDSLKPTEWSEEILFCLFNSLFGILSNDFQLSEAEINNSYWLMDCYEKIVSCRTSYSLSCVKRREMSMQIVDLISLSEKNFQVGGIFTRWLLKLGTTLELLPS